MTMRKRIAFLAGAISFDNQNRVLGGVLKRASELDMDVYVFTCFVNYDESEENKVGAFRIMDLPEFDLFDGVICMKNSIQYEPAVNSLIARIKKSKVPAVSVDEKVDGMYNVGISDYSSQKDIVEHLIETHDLKKINYVCGILQGKEGRERYNAYRDAMEEHGMELDLTGLENIDELCEKIKKYVVGSDMQSFYMCLCDKNELFADKSVCDHFTEKVSIPLAYQNGKFCSYDDFLSKEILPLEIREKSKRTFYTVTPIYYQHICYGYCVSDGSLFALKSELSYLWTVNIGMALENIRKWQWINRMNEKINRMWKYDMLTQVLNRSGFFYCAETILQKIKEEKSNAFIIFLDIDGLKSVNDNLGHEIGDAFIAKIAGILKEVVPKDCLIMRYGGDEFVVFGSCKQAGRMQRIAEDIKAAIKTADQKENRSYHLAASLGCSLHKSYEMDNLNSLIELADKKMYEEKKNKRR